MLSVLWFTTSDYPIVLSVLWFTTSDYPIVLSVLRFTTSDYTIVLSVLWFITSDYPFGIFWPLYCLSGDLPLLNTPLVSFGHCIVCPAIYHFWLLLWYLLAIVLSVLWFTTSDYPVGIFWPLYCLSCDLPLLITPLYLLAFALSVLWFITSDYPFGICWPLYCLSCDLPLLITPLVSFGHCIVCPVIYHFWLPLWYLLAIVLSVLWFTTSDYPFGIFWPLYCLSCDLPLLITLLVSLGHCIVCPVIYHFWLPLWYLLAIVLSVLWFTTSDYPFGIFWSLYCLSCDLPPLITLLVSLGHCIVCPVIYHFWLPLWYPLAIALFVLWFTTSDYPFGIIWPLYFLSCDLPLLITPLVSFGHCIVCPAIYHFWLPLWYLLAIVLSVLWFTTSDYPFGIFWPLYCLSSIYHFWLPFWYLLAIALSVLWFTTSDCPFGIFWPLYCLSCDLRLLITQLVSFGHCIICPAIYHVWLPLWYFLTIALSVLRFTTSDFPFGIFWPLYCLSCDLPLLITPLVSFGHCIVCPAIYHFWLLLWYLLAIVLSVLRFTTSDYPFGIFWPLYCLSGDLPPLITPLVSFGHCIVCPVIYHFWLPLWYLLAIVLYVLRFTTSDYSFGIFRPFYCLSVIYHFWLPLWYHLTIVFSVLWFTTSDYSFGIFWQLYCLSCDLPLLITPLVSFGHCIVCPVIYHFWLPLWYHLTIVFSVLWFTTSDYPFGIFWSLYCMSCNLPLLITPLVSFGHCIICPAIYHFWLPLWYLLAIVLSVLRFTTSEYPFGIFWPLYCLFCDLPLLITPLVSFGHCIVCSVIYHFWLSLWYLVAIVLSVLDLPLLITLLVSFGHCIVCPVIYDFWLPNWYLLAIVLPVLRFTTSDYPFDIFWPLHCLSCDLPLLISPLVSFGHCIVCPAIYHFWLLLWYLLAIVLSVLRFTTSDYSFGIFWPLYCLSCDLPLLITPLVSFGHCIVCPVIYHLWLPPWYLLAIVLSVLWFTTSDYPFVIFWPLYCLSCDLSLLITPLVSLAIVFSVLWFTTSDYPFGIFWPLYCLSCDLPLLITPLVSFGHCIVCPVIYHFWLPLWYLLAFVLSVLWFITSDYLFGIFWPLYCLSCDLSLLITPLVSFGHCIVCPVIYHFWLPLWYLLAIVLSVLWFTTSDYPLGIFWPLYCLSCDLPLLIIPLVSFGHCIIVLWFITSDYSFGILWPLYCLSCDLPLLITPLVSFDHCIVCPVIYHFWLPLWYLLAIVLSVLWFTTSDYPFGIFWPLYCLSSDLSLLIIPLVSFGHCIVCPVNYHFWLPLWYLLAIVLSVLWFTTSDYSFGIFWPLYCLSCDLSLLIIPLVSFGHCIVCPVNYHFWLPLWYLLAIVLSVLWFTTSDYPFGIFWPLYYRSVIYHFWLLLWYL